MERRLTRDQENLVHALQQFVASADTTLFVVLPDDHFGKTYALTEWISRCDSRQCASILLLTTSRTQAIELLADARARLQPRPLIRGDLRRFVQFEGTPSVYVQKLEDAPRHADVTIHLDPVSLLDQPPDEAHAARKNVWFIHERDCKRVRNAKMYSVRTMCVY